MTYIKLAWRNIWRNKRRTFITMGSIFFAVFFAIMTRSMQLGSYARMIENVVQTYTGYIQIHEKGYWKDKDINNTIEYTPELVHNVEKITGINFTIPRIETGVLAAGEKQSKVAFLVGTNPQKEDSLTKISKRIIEGSFFKENEKSVVMAAGLADFLKLKLGDTLVMLGQGYHGVSAAGKYPITGIVKFPIPDLNNRMVYMPLKQTQDFLSAPNQITCLTVSLSDYKDLQTSLLPLREKLDSKEYEVMSWKEILTELVQQIELDNGSGKIMIGILYLIIGFGIFGTVLMMTAERRREFGVMIAVGMQKFKLCIILIIEMIFIGIMGIISGTILSTPIVFYYNSNPIKLTGDMAKGMENFGVEPILPFSTDFQIFLNQSIVVMIIVFIAIIYPIYSVSKLKLMKALRA